MADVTIDNREKKSKNENFLSQNKHLALFLVGWIGFTVVATLLQLAAMMIFHGEDAISRSDVAMAINCFSYGIILVILLTIFGFDNLKKLTEKFVYLKTYIAAVLCLASIIAFETIYSQILDICGAPIVNNENQSALEELMSLYPVLCIIFFAIVGPITEELTYRVGLFSLCKKKSKILAYIVTPVVFAFIHFNLPSADIKSPEFTSNLINELLNLPAYCFAGLAFCFTYDHYGFESSVTAHILNNLLSFLLMLKK